MELKLQEETSILCLSVIATHGCQVGRAELGIHHLIGSRGGSYTLPWFPWYDLNIPICPTVLIHSDKLIGGTICTPKNKSLISLCCVVDSGVVRLTLLPQNGVKNLHVKQSSLDKAQLKKQLFYTI